MLKGWRAFTSNPQWVIAIVCFVCFVGPAAMVVQGAFKTQMFGSSGSYTAEMFWEVLRSTDTHSVIIQTVLMGLATIVLSTFFALLFATIYAKTNTVFRQAIPVIMFIVIATPGLFFAIAWGLLGNQNVGLLNQLMTGAFGEAGRIFNMESWWGIVFVSSLRLIALQFFLLLGPFLAMDRSLDEAARLSGAGPVRTFFQIELPIMAPAITGAMILGFVLFLESFDAPQILGVPAGIFVIPTEIYAYLSNSTGPLFAQASSISVLLMVVLMVLVFIQIKVLGRRSFVTIGGKESRALRRDIGPWRWLFSALVLGFAAVTIILPMVQLIRVSLSPFLGASEGFSFDNYEEVLTNRRMVSGYWNTMGTAMLGALLAVLAATAFAWAARFKGGVLSRFIEYSQWLGLAMPGLILALGVLWLFLGLPFLSTFYGTPVLMVFALFVATIPLASRTATAAMAQIPKSLEEAAWVSGASKYRAIWDIIIRLMLPSLVSGWLLCFVVISGVLSIPLLLSTAGADYLSVQIYSRYVEGKAPIAAAAALLLIASFLVVAGIAYLAGRLLALTRPEQRSGKGPGGGTPADLQDPVGPDPTTESAGPAQQLARSR
ncbi:iron ABC transporter permease [Arthrobacter koreensis]|uniref:Iron ABC transporter permease n=1 Tax=Arthrobacter koreensis TaxID=199136 RepID=A0ABY6FRL8_9MICC|nr:iron ABC transporter permease [Arthrobacter koreensis]UYB35853.1 iron ABC transporter permease [Arthrobacter koreensis]